MIMISWSQTKAYGSHQRGEFEQIEIKASRMQWILNTVLIVLEHDKEIA